MVNQIGCAEESYTTSKVASMLDMSVPTIRKHAQILESKGYVFLRGKVVGKHQTRLFVNKDVTMLKYLKELRSKSNMKVEQAASIVLEKFGKGEIQSVNNELTTELNEYEENYTNEDIVNLIQGLTERLDKQGKYITEQNNYIRQQQDDIKEKQQQIEQYQHYIDRRIKEEREQLLSEMVGSRSEKPENKNRLFSALFRK